MSKAVHGRHSASPFLDIIDIASPPHRVTHQTHPTRARAGNPPKMPIPLISHGVAEGISAIPYVFTVLKAAAAIAVVALLKYFFGGARNTSERLMHSKVVMVTVHPLPYTFNRKKKADRFCLRAEHQASAPPSSTTSPLAAPKSSFSHSTHPPTYSSSTTSKTCDNPQTTNSYTPNKSISRRCIRSAHSPRNGSTMRLRGDWT